MRLPANKIVQIIFALITALIVFTVGKSSAHPAVDIVASNWKFTPATVEAHVGEATALNLTSSEGVHGIESADLGIPMTTMMPGKITAVTFTPKKAGTYDVHCAIVCGAGHEKMILTVTVVP